MAKRTKADWAAGKDFIIRDLDQSGRYINKADAAGLTVMVRYKQDRQIGKLQ